MHELEGALVLRGDPPLTASLAAEVTVTTSPLQVSAPWMPEPVAVDDDASLFDHATTEVYDLAAILHDLANDPGPVALARYACD